MIEAASVAAEGVDLGALLGGGAGASILLAIVYVVKLIIDRTLPSRSDSRANISILLEGLQSIVKVLQDEKAADARRLADQQSRIDALKNEADVSYTRKAEMQAEIFALHAQLARKDQHIQEFINLLSQLGVKVEGLEADSLKFTLPPDKPNPALVV